RLRPNACAASEIASMTPPKTSAVVGAFTTSLLPSLAATHKSVNVPPTSVPTTNPSANVPPPSGNAEFAFLSTRLFEHAQFQLCLTRCQGCNRQPPIRPGTPRRPLPRCRWCSCCDPRRESTPP